MRLLGMAVAGPVHPFQRHFCTLSRRAGSDFWEGGLIKKVERLENF